MANEILEMLKRDGRDGEELFAFASVADAAIRMEPAAKGQPGEFFRFVLDAVGRNDNGTRLTREEAGAAAKSAVGKKIKMATQPITKPGDLHERSFTSKVGKIVEAQLVGDKLVCRGRIYDTTEHQRLCRESLADGDIGFVSKENSFAEGECSKCGKHFRKKRDICAHLRIDPATGWIIGTSQADVIMHGVTYSAVALLDKPGAHAAARILEVAAENLATTEENMDGKDGNLETAAAKAEDLQAAEKRVKDLEEQVASLTKERDELHKRVETFEAKEKDRAVESLIATMEKKGKTFADGKAKADEIAKLKALSAEAFAAKKEAWEELPEPKAATDEKAGDEAKPGKTDEPAGETGASKINTKKGGAPADRSDRNDGADPVALMRRRVGAR
ncbi:hypothetical protein K8I61_17315 [bacterium]|nr:hypothetical protein [bacterium]